MSGRLIGYLGVSATERLSWILGSEPIFVMQAADVWEGNHLSALR